VREGAPLLEGAPLGMRRRDERLGKSVKCWDYTKDEEKEGVTLLESAPHGQNSTQTQVWVRWSDKDHY
jgi:hypothetical protein